MAVFICEADAFNKMVEVEGPGYCGWRSQGGDYSFAAFLETWKERYESGAVLPEKSSATTIDVAGNHAIYGYGKINRYFVLENGEILFSESHGRSSVELAKKAGFRIRESNIR